MDYSHLNEFNKIIINDKIFTEKYDDILYFSNYYVIKFKEISDGPVQLYNQKREIFSKKYLTFIKHIVQYYSKNDYYIYILILYSLCKMIYFNIHYKLYTITFDEFIFIEEHILQFHTDKILFGNKLLEIISNNLLLKNNMKELHVLLHKIIEKYKGKYLYNDNYIIDNINYNNILLYNNDLFITIFNYIPNININNKIWNLINQLIKFSIKNCSKNYFNLFKIINKGNNFPYDLIINHIYETNEQIINYIYNLLHECVSSKESKLYKIYIDYYLLFNNKNIIQKKFIQKYYQYNDTILYKKINQYNNDLLQIYYSNKDSFNNLTDEKLKYYHINKEEINQIGSCCICFTNTNLYCISNKCNHYIICKLCRNILLKNKFNKCPYCSILFNNFNLKFNYNYHLNNEIKKFIEIYKFLFI